MNIPCCLPLINDFIEIVTATGTEYSTDRLILCPNVEINCDEYFMQHIFWSTWNANVIAQSPDHNMKNCQIAIEFLAEKQVRLEVNKLLET